MSEREVAQQLAADLAANAGAIAVILGVIGIGILVFVVVRISQAARTIRETKALMAEPAAAFSADCASIYQVNPDLARRARTEMRYKSHRQRPVL